MYTQGATILLIEDDPLLSSLYKQKFIIEGFSVITERDGIEGLAKALNESYDILLLDVGLPRKSGLEILKELRSTEKGKVIPVIVLSNFANEERKEALDLKANEYLVKAMQTPEQVVEKIKEVLQST